MASEVFRRIIERSTRMTLEAVRAMPLADTWKRVFGARDKRRQKALKEKIARLFREQRHI